MKKIFFLIFLITNATLLFSQPIYNQDGVRLYHVPSEEEKEWARRITPSTIAPTDAPVGELRPIAEYEPAEAVLIRYPLGIPLDLIREMSEDCQVITLVKNSSHEISARNQYVANSVNISNCTFVHTETDSYWTRDYGPWFMAIDNSEVAMYDFTYNRPRYNDNNVNSVLANHLSLDRYASGIEHCGGNFMNDGTSQAASTMLVLEENLTYTEAQLQQHFSAYMGIDLYHFVEDPLSEYIMHIDCWGKYLAPNKVMIGEVPQSDDRYALYEATADYFASLTSPWGTPMEVYRVYTPGSEQYPTAYTNSLILNNKVFVPLSGNSHDAAAIQSYQAAMPGYEIIGIQYDFWENTDALHCRTHEIADRCMLYLAHTPFHGYHANTGSMTFSAEVYSYCDHEIYPDSVIVYLKSGEGEFLPYQMSHSGENRWERTINDLPDGRIEYYLFAADVSGRRECHPYIGAPDPHEFTLIGQSPSPVISLNKTSSSVISNSPEIVEDQIIISNRGTADLVFEITDIDFDEMLSFSMLTATVAPDDFAEIVLYYDFSQMVAKSDHSGSMLILSNDPLNPVIEISLEAILSNIGINNVNISETKIYPNPANDVIHIDYDGHQNGKAYIYSILGEQVKEVTITAGANRVHIADLPAGIYIIKINLNTFKFIKR